MCNALQAHSRPRASGDQKIGMPIGPKNRLQPRSLTQAARPMLQPLRRRRSPLGRLLEHPVGDVLDVIGAEALAEGGHGALAVGDLVRDGLNIVAAREVLLKSLLLQLLLGHDAVVAAGMAGRAITLEDRLAVLQVGGKRRAAANDGGQQPQRHAEREGAPSSATAGRCSRRLAELEGAGCRASAARKRRAGGGWRHEARDAVERCGCCQEHAG
mmetsp:Transcript_36142/g.82139  ORF Transcript_36142/g.82139 Transcript_36142/m.82139 type:complete len:214 (-) Transcript_36142:88-729(-)